MAKFIEFKAQLPKGHGYYETPYTITANVELISNVEARFDENGKFVTASVTVVSNGHDFYINDFETYKKILKELSPKVID